ncbi:MAG: OPT/YSL family transporter [Elusimicrobiales bacterium]|nr:OPT/YSL family transporter [Elusimicrobiales bacterium]
MKKKETNTALSLKNGDSPIQRMNNKTEMTDISQEAAATLDTTDPELKWYKEVYQGDHMKQLTVRAVIMGALLGGFMSLSNLYVGLKTGWGLGVAITACILSFAIWKALQSALGVLGMKVSSMTILENNCMQSTASSAGYSTGGTMTSAIAAYLLITGTHMPWHVLVLWTIFLAMLGVFIAIPMKRQMINIEKLKFPSGIAAAETLRSLHAEGAEATQKAKALAYSGLIGALLGWLRDSGKPFLGLWNWGNNFVGKFFGTDGIFEGGMLKVYGKIQGIELHKWTISAEMSLLMIAAGAIIGWKMCWSLLFGAILNYAVLAPYAVNAEAIDPANVGYRAIVAWSTWTGAAIMVTSALYAFAKQWKTIAKAFSGIKTLFTGKKDSTHDPLAHIEVPTSWFLTGTGIAGLGCIIVLYHYFNTSIFMGIVAVALTFVLAIVAARATGESDITPVGAMGKITQLMFGVIAPTNMTTNLMTASVTAGAAGSTADLLTDLKSGYLLGANPRQQFLAQFFGIFAGTIVVVPAFYLLVPDASALGTQQWPAPSAQVWAAVAKLLSNGFNSLHITARWGLLIGGIAGIIIPLITDLLPEKARKFIPSAMGIGLAMVIPFYNSLSMFLGGLIALVLEKVAKPMSDKYLVPSAAGIIAGESIIGIVIALLMSTGKL